MELGWVAVVILQVILWVMALVIAVEVVVIVAAVVEERRLRLEQRLAAVQQELNRQRLLEVEDLLEVLPPQEK